MTQIGTPCTKNAVKVMLLGAGELGKELVISLQRLGVETIAVDQYPGAPAMQLAHRAAVIDMMNPLALRDLVHAEKPDLIVPEVEAIATEELQLLEDEGFRVVPTAKAVRLTMNRESIRRLAAEQLKLLTSDYGFASSQDEYEAVVQRLGFPAVVKPAMSSSGKGQMLIHNDADAQKAFDYALEAGRGKTGSVIVEKWVKFDYEVTLLTIRHRQGLSFCEPIGHRQENGDYQESWQPQEMKPEVLQEAKKIATLVTQVLGGYGLFGVELFVKGDQVYFSEVSPRPHDTGMVTLISQNLSEFDLHVRAILGLPIPKISLHGPAASKAIVVAGDSNEVSFGNLNQVLVEEGTDLRLFGKPEVCGHRRMGVVLAIGQSTEEACSKVKHSVSRLKIKL